MDNCLPHLSNYQIRQLQSITDKLQRLLNAAAHVVSNTWKFDRGSTHLLHSELHWLDVPQRIFYKLRVTVHRCLLSKARLPSTSWTAATPHRMLPVVSDFDLLAATISSYHDIVAPRHRRNTLGRRVCNALYKFKTYLLTYKRSLISSSLQALVQHFAYIDIYCRLEYCNSLLVGAAHIHLIHGTCVNATLTLM